MKKLIIVLLVSLGAFAQWKKDVKHVITHNRTTVTCESSGNSTYKGWGVFPSAKTSVRKMEMHVTLGSPDSINTAHWDYLDHITIRRVGGTKGKSEDLEIGRMLTPYGSIYNKGWNWKWKVDVTDFAFILRDSIEIEYNHSGYEPKTVGWALTIDFEVVVGDEVMKPLGMQKLWAGGFKYGDPNDKIEEKLLPIKYTSAPEVALNRVRIQHTGHGMDTPKGCSEFCSRWREIKIDNQTIDKRDMWKDCGANPLYPQGGTWIYDRAYWCPGDLQVPDVIDVPAKAGEHSISLTMEPYVATENIQANESIYSYVFFYAKPNKKTDAAIDKIMAPTNEQQYARLNPATFNSRFVIRNLGSDNLKSAVITYSTEGFPKQTYNWKGDLKFNETAEILIPDEIKYKDGVNTFSVSLAKPNGKADEYPADNMLTSTFDAPRTMPTNFIIKFLTNNKPKDNHVFLVGEKSKIFYEYKPEQLEEAKLYTDTISLKDGKYELCLTDSEGDGLEFWHKSDNGDGYLRVFDLKGNLIHAFESDCGNGEKLSFAASSKFVAPVGEEKYAFSLHPRLVKTYTELSVFSNIPTKMNVQITVDGVIHENHNYISVKEGSFRYFLGNLPKGRIVLEVFMNGVSKFKGRINKQ